LNTGSDASEALREADWLPGFDVALMVLAKRQRPTGFLL